MPDPTIAERAEQYREIAKETYSGILDGVIRSDPSKLITAIFQDVISVVLKTGFAALAPIGEGMARGISESEDVLAPVLARYATAAVNDIFGTNVSEAQFSRLRGGDARTVAGPALGRAIMGVMKGTDGGLAPGDAAASRYVGAFAGAAVEDWFKGWFFEVISSLVPWLDVGKIEAYGGLGDKVSNILGVPGVSRRVLRPLVDTTIVTPLEWQTNKTYRPRLLSPAEVLRQISRGRWTREQGNEELARQGYSDTRIEALLSAQRKFFSPGDVRTFQYFGHWTGEESLQHLRDQGYDEPSAASALRLEGLRRNAAHEDACASVIVSAYAARDIDAGTFRGLLGDVVTNQAERTFALELGEIRRAVNTRRITSAQTAAAVKAKILNVVDYRRALEREGYPDEDVLVLELLLRADLDDRADREQQRAAAVAERAAEKAARELERRRRAAELEEQRAADRRGPTAALEAAAIRGLVPIARVEELYRQDFDADAVAVLVSLLEDKRIAYLDAEQRRADAEQRAARKGLAMTDVRAAVLAGVLTLNDFSAHLERGGMDAGDVAILTATLAAQISTRAEALKQRRAAEAAAQRRRIDLGRFEQLVRRGARSLEQYGALLAELGFDAGSVAGMRELLELQIADDARARAAREAADSERRERGPTVSQFMRGVLLNVKTPAEYEQFLIANRFSVDAQIVLMAELRNELAEADAARRRREATAAGVEPRALPLSTVRRAAQLGAISPATYVARLEAAGYSADDIELELDLLLLEIAEAQQQRADRDAAAAGAGARGLSLTQAERAVKARIASMDDYRAAVAAAGYSAEATAQLVALLERELAQLGDARGRRDTIAEELASRDLNLSQLEEAVKKGFRTLDDFYAEVVGLGYGSDDAELLTALLATELGAGAGAE